MWGRSKSQMSPPGTAARLLGCALLLIPGACLERDPSFMDPTDGVSGGGTDATSGTTSVTTGGPGSGPGPGTNSATASGSSNTTDSSATTTTGTGGSGGSTTGPQCGMDEILCGGECTNVTGNQDHCGACYNACNATLEVCGAMGCECRPGTLECGSCINPNTNKQNCGTCGTKCGGQTCMAGTCMAGTCIDGLTSCGGGCTDTMTDPLHCGGCNMACAPTESCVDGVCG